MDWRIRKAGMQASERENEAHDAAGGERLRALTRRIAQGEQQEAGAATAPGSTIALTLASNPFALLELDLTADAAALNEAYDRLSFEPGRDEAALTDARAALMSPRDRLAAEIRWVPGLPRATLVALCSALRASDGETIASIANKASDIARFNLSHALFQSRSLEPQAAALVVEAGSVDADRLLERLEEARFSAREREIDRLLFDEALTEWAVETGNAAALAFAGTASGRAMLTRTLQADPSPKGRFDSRFREALLRSYGAEVAKGLDTARINIDAAIGALREDPEKPAHLTMLLTNLDIWSSLRRPMQVHEAARGLDDPASGEIFAAVRSLSVDLSNQHEQFEVALRLGRALLATFALVPMHRAALEREVPTMIGNAAVKRARHLRERALAEPRAFAREIEAGGLDRAGGIAGSIRILFDDVSGLYDGNALDHVFSAIRDIAITLHNEARQRVAAYKLIAWLTMQGPPASIAMKLEEDLAHFGVKADVAVRERETPPSSASRDAPAPPPGSFGRARKGGAEAADDRNLPERPARSRGQAALPAAPPRYASDEERPAGRKAQRRRPWSAARFGILGMVLLTALCSRHHRAEDKQEERARSAAGQSTQGETFGTFRSRAQPPGPTSERSGRRLSDDEINRLVERLRQQRGGGAPGQPVFRPGEPMQPVGTEPRGVQP